MKTSSQAWDFGLMIGHGRTMSGYIGEKFRYGNYFICKFNQISQCGRGLVGESADDADFPSRFCGPVITGADADFS
jgi:hypothetical protein